MGGRLGSAVPSGVHGDAVTLLMYAVPGDLVICVRSHSFWPDAIAFRDSPVLVGSGTIGIVLHERGHAYIYHSGCYERFNNFWKCIDECEDA